MICAAGVRTACTPATPQRHHMELMVVVLSCFVPLKQQKRSEGNAPAERMLIGWKPMGAQAWEQMFAMCVDIPSPE
eukprot:1861984-Pyramimonas_sp.AAC.1